MSWGEIQRRLKRVQFWFTWAMMPLGYFCSPIVFANAVSEFVTWKEPIIFVITWWDVYVSEPIAQNLSLFIKMLSFDIYFPIIPPLATDYIAVGFAMYGVSYRSYWIMRAFDATDLIANLCLLFWPAILWPAFIDSITSPYKYTRLLCTLISIPSFAFIFMWIINIFLT